MRPQRVSDETILSTARRIFLAHGAGVSVDQIAAELDISTPAIFKRFGTKRNLMLMAIKPPKEIPWRKAVESGPDDRPFTVQLREVAGAIASFLAEIVPVLRVIHTSDISFSELMCDHEVPLPVMAVGLLSSWLERCCQKGLIRKTDFRLAAMSILGTFHLETLGSLFRDRTDQSPSVPLTYLDDVVSLIWQGLRNER